MSQWKKLTESFQKEWKKIHNEHPSGTSADEAEKLPSHLNKLKERML